MDHTTESSLVFTTFLLLILFELPTKYFIRAYTKCQQLFYTVRHIAYIFFIQRYMCELCFIISDFLSFRGVKGLSPICLGQLIYFYL